MGLSGWVGGATSVLAWRTRSLLYVAGLLRPSSSFRFVVLVWLHPNDMLLVGS